MIPDGGFTFYNTTFEGNYCKESLATFDSFLDDYFKWTLNLDLKWGGLGFFVPYKSDKPEDCGAKWYTMITYVYQGSKKDDAYKLAINKLTENLKPTTVEEKSLKNWWERISV